MKGHFITFEGGDGAGKTSLIISLHAALIKKGLSVIQTRAPGGTEMGKVIRQLLLHPQEPVAPRSELFLYLADRAQHVEEVIRPSLEEGKIVLCDRYSDSTVAYQGGGRGFGLEKMEELCAFATDGLQPTLTLYLDLDPEVGLMRVKEAMGRKDQIESETLAFHQAIRQTFLHIAEKHPSRFRLIDASQSREEVFEQALKLIDSHVLAERL